MSLVGKKFEYTKKVTDEDIRLFAQVSGDHNPLHLDDEYAKTTMFGRRIAHGMISASFISAAIAMEIPGEGTTYLSQNLQFKKPVFPGDTLKVTLEITDLQEKSKFSIATVSTVVENQDGDIVTQGEAKIIPSKDAL